MRSNCSVTMKAILFTALLAAGSAQAGTAYTTKPATGITATGATLNGEALSTVGLGAEIFSYGTTTNYGNTVSGSPQGVNGPVSATIGGLTCNTTYHFKFTGRPGSSRTTIQGSDLTFTTLACAIPPTQGFAGTFAPATWISGSNAPVNLVNTSGAPASVMLSSYPIWQISGASFAHGAPSNGTVSFSYNFSFSPTTGPTSAVCPGTYSVNGQPTQFTNNTGPNVQVGSTQFNVKTGDIFSFALNGANLPTSFGCQNNNPNNANLPPTTLTITNFVFTPTN